MSSSSSPPSQLATNNATSAPTSSAPPGCSPPAKLVLNLPPGYHFLPTDDELVVHYLRPRLAGNHRLPLPIFVNERILNYHPDILIEKYRQYGEGRWFFFTERERKHLGGNRPNRTTPDNGHWNATGSIRPIRSADGVLVGCCRTLVFYEASRRKKKKNQAGLLAAAAEDGERSQAAAKGKDGVKTEWTMYEYESLTSEAEFEAISRSGNAHKLDVVVLCTIQKKKHGQEGGETKKSTKRRKTKEEEGLGGVGEMKKSTKRRKTKEEEGLEAVPAAAGNVEQGSRRASTREGRQADEDEDHVQRAQALMEAAAAPEPQQELAYHDDVGNFNVDPNQLSTPYAYLINSLSSHLPTPPQETAVIAPARVENHTVMHQQNYYFINHSMNMNNSQTFPVQETPPPQEFLPYTDTKMAAAAPSRGGGNTMDHVLQNRFVNTRPVWERLAELPGDKPNMALKSEDAWWSSHHLAKLSERELHSPYATNSLSLVPAPHQQQETVKKVLADRGYNYNHTVMHQRNYSNLPMNMRNSQFHVQPATLPQEEFLPYSSSTKMMAAPRLGGGSIMGHHMPQNRVVNVMPAAGAHTFSGFCPGLSNSNNYGHLGSNRMDHPAGPSSVPFPLQQSHGAESRTSMMHQGLLLNNNQVNLNHQNSAAAAASASMVGYDQRNGAGLAPKIV